MGSRKISQFKHLHSKTFLLRLINVFCLRGSLNLACLRENKKKEVNIYCPISGSQKCTMNFYTLSFLYFLSNFCLFPLTECLSISVTLLDRSSKMEFWPNELSKSNICKT